MIEVKREQDVSREARQEDDTSGGVVEHFAFSCHFDESGKISSGNEK